MKKQVVSRQNMSLATTTAKINKKRLNSGLYATESRNNKGYIHRLLTFVALLNCFDNAAPNCSIQNMGTSYIE